MKRDVPISEMIANTGDYAEAILCISQTLPLPRIALLLLAVTMVISVYSYKKIKADAEPDKRIKTFWAVVFILFPIALIFSEESIPFAICIDYCSIPNRDSYCVDYNKLF